MRGNSNIDATPTIEGQMFTIQVEYTGSVALKKGQAVCYDLADTAGKYRAVAVPTTSNNRRFAGVTHKSELAPTNNERKIIEIHPPGSVARVSCGLQAVTDGTTRMTFNADLDPGRFVLEGLAGRGTAVAMETDASAAIEDSHDGSAALDATGLILTDASATFITNGLAAGDKIVIYCGESDGTNTITAGTYTVSSVDLETQVTLTAVASDGGTMIVTYYALPAADQPTVLAYLENGPESGGLEAIILNDNAASQSMVGGMTVLGPGAVTLAAGDATSTLADGTEPGELKGFICRGVLTTQDYLLTTTSANQSDGSTTLNNLEFDGAGDLTILEWSGNFAGQTTGVWTVKHIVGAAEA